MTAGGDQSFDTVAQHGDPRGVFVEMLKTPDAGQFSYFTAHPGITRGGHYHHSKTEKFLVIKGQARFKSATCKRARRMSWLPVAKSPRLWKRCRAGRMTSPTLAPTR